MLGWKVMMFNFLYLFFFILKYVKSYSWLEHLESTLRLRHIFVAPFNSCATSSLMYGKRMEQGLDDVY